MRPSGDIDALRSMVLGTGRSAARRLPCRLNGVRRCQLEEGTGATGEIVAMNRELFGTLNLVRQINAEGVRPVQ